MAFVWGYKFKLNKMKQKTTNRCNLSDFVVNDNLDNCKPFITSKKTIWWNPKTKEVFDELDNFLGYGTYDEKNKIIEVKTDRK